MGPRNGLDDLGEKKTLNLLGSHPASGVASCTKCANKYHNVAPLSGFTQTDQ